MPSLKDLLNVVPNFDYYSGGPGNFAEKNIPFGDDQPGGGSSGQPYIVKQEGFQWSPSNFDDGTVRLGIVGATTRTAADVLRIGKFLTDVPRGPLFIAKQVGLQLSNPKLEGLFNAPKTPAGDTLLSQVTSLPTRIAETIGTTRTYNLGLNTLAQVGISAFGGHAYRHGLTPDMDDSQKYLSITQVNNIDKSNGTVSINSANRLVRYTANLSDSGQLTIDSYQGGPQSVFGIGTTTIQRSVDTIGNSSVTQVPINGFTPIKISDLAKIGRDGILVTSGGTDFNTKTQDFRALKNTLYNAGLPSTDYPTLNIGTRISRGNPGAPGQDRSNYSNSLLGTQDLINKLSLFYASAPPGTDSQIIDLNSGEVVNAPQVRDIIKFRIEAIDNDNPAYSVWMVFRAFISEFHDSHTQTLDSHTYTGRGEDFYTSEKTNRQISFNFKIVAQSRDEMKPLYQKLNYLISCLYPDYNTSNKMRGSLIKLTVGDYIYRQPAWISSLDIGIPQEANWEIALQEPNNGVDADMHEVPMLLDVSITVIPIHDFLPRKGASTPFISVNGRKSPSDPLSPPAPNNWLADSPVTKGSDGNLKYTPLSDKVSAARNAALK